MQEMEWIRRQWMIASGNGKGVRKGVFSY